ncbi:nischarin isoform X2 [Lingula anatina]|uniref:Nischarin isoform X2 n=1 Tax=Lingula anatina TaxID=7574 RepID=A0A1S3I2R1_LINAN|nr:nischarin isoform X2 [Lingula anatina]|eukprot:XP_013392557.1 nischarin isoform X2 [Lingula anatina]
MAHFNRDVEGFTASRVVKTIGSENVDNYTVYILEVYCGSYSWTVRHRYSEFHELHERLVTKYKIDKTLLPPKKVFGNQNEEFIKKRQADLELYLQVLMHYLPKLPPELAFFLDFDKYEIHGITQLLAEHLFEKGEKILQSQQTFVVSPLHLNAVTQRLKLPEPTCDTGDMRKDLGHILDFFTRLKYLKILGTKEPLGTSNIEVNQLSFEMNCFKSLTVLELDQCNIGTISVVDTVKKTLKHLIVHGSLQALKDMLLRDIVYWQTEDTEETAVLPVWESLQAADFSHNEIKEIDESVRLMPRLEYLDLSRNQLSDVQHLHYLPALSQVNLAHNRLRTLESLHVRLGNVKILNLSGNQLDTLEGLSKLYSLETLNVSKNKLAEVENVQCIGKLPCLENLILRDNPIRTVVDYRVAVLELFGDRAKEVLLDKEATTQQELDKIAVRLALQKAKDDRAKRQSTSSTADTSSIPN